MWRSLRVPLVARPLDVVMTLGGYGVLPLLLGLLSVPFVESVADAPGGLVVGLAAGAVVAVYLLLLQAPSVRHRVLRTAALARRQVILRCNHGFDRPGPDSWLACQLTPPAFRLPLFRYDNQRAVVDRLLAACSERDDGQFWFVQGASGSGKTRTALLLVDALVRDADLFEVAGKVYLYDLGVSPGMQARLLRRLGTPRHEGAVVLVDNFQHATGATVRALTRFLVDHHRSRTERMVVFLCRPEAGWHLEPGADFRLASEARSAGRYVELSGPSAGSVVEAVATIAPGVPRRLRALHDERVASAVQLHLAQVIAHNEGEPPEVAGIIDLLLGSSDDHPPADLLRALAIISALSMHVGSFARRQAKEAVRTASAEGGWSAVERRRVRKTIRRLSQMGLVPRLRVHGDRYLFHEAMAEQCIDHLSSIQTFAEPFVAVAAGRLRQLAAAADPAAWSIAVEIGDEAMTSETFDDAMATGAYEQMRRCIARAADRGHLSSEGRLQHAILLDRVGDFASSRALMTDELAAAFAPSSDLAVRLVTGRIEAGHEADAHERLRPLRRHGDPFVGLVATYWQIHLDGHKGRFRPDDLSELADEAVQLRPDGRNQWEVHAVARMHFDGLRHGYLAGVATPSTVERADRTPAADLLRRALPTYEALRLLYCEAHLLAHVRTPGLRIYREGTSADPTLDPVAPLHQLEREVHQTYRRTQDEFWLYGDRESKYLQADVLNAEMVMSDAPLTDLTVRLHLYEQFIRAADFADLASYPHLYFARWHVLSHYAAALQPAQGPSDVEDHLGAAERRLLAASACDQEAGNRFGCLRSSLLLALVRATSAPLERAPLERLHAEAAMESYESERRLVEHVLEADGLTSAELRTILRFYPIVHQ
jgi:hypothetical protein